MPLRRLGTRFYSTLKSALPNLIRKKCEIFASRGIQLPKYVLGCSENVPKSIEVHDVKAIAELHKAGQITRQILKEIGLLIKPGISTADIELLVINKCIEKAVYPSPLAFEGYPCCVCTSLNDVAIHGIPSEHDILRSGDLLSVDVTVFTGKAHGDACETFLICDEDTLSVNYTQKRHLIACARRACESGIAVCGPGVAFAAIAESISQEVFEMGCRVVAGIGGHSIGDYFHGPPYVAHSVFERESQDAGVRMLPGHVFTIEPVIATAAQLTNGDTDEVIRNVALPVVSTIDNFSVRTTDRALTAQFEEMVLITEEGVHVLTR
uniref:Peptidase_M24 domain-containing protein n=1 Tax=Mesocestoides corti TaxID=53468 RepID=A0A5K3FSE3_MESCO